MSRRRAATGAGSRVGGGRLRVDAARAVGKLRDYQLADPAMWALEAVRAAAALGASAVHLDGDADDVWVAWEGEPIAEADLTRLLDELVSPEARDERRALRLLATAINTALGLGPRYVDVYAIEHGAGVRARYAPQLLATTGEGGAEGLRNLTAAPAALPAGAPAIGRGSLVHMRRFPALEALSLLATGQEPREMRIARRACEDFPLPLRIGHGPLARHHAAADLLRVCVDPGALGGAGREAFLALTELARLEAYVDYAELGVVLATQPLAIPIEVAPGARLPIRARIDAPRLPTNASRSAIRRDEPWCRRAEEALAAALGELVARVVRELGPDAEAEWSPKARARLRDAAIALAAAPIAGPEWRHAIASAPEALAPLYDAPLARDALGRARSIRELARAGHAAVHTDPEPVPAELEPWLGEVPWVAPGDAIGRLWGASPPPSAERLIAEARASRAARARWLERPVAAPVLGGEAGRVVLVPLQAPGKSAASCIPARVFSQEGLAGEVGIPLHGAARSVIALLVDGRETEISRRESPLPFHAVATAAALRLAPAHDAVADDDAKRAVLRACSAAAVVGCEAVARRAIGRRAPHGETARFPAGEELAPDDARAIVRAGVRLAVQVLAETTDDGKRTLLESRSPLLEAPAWPTADGGHASLAAIVQAARGAGIVGWVARRAEPVAIASRTILVLDDHERALLALLVGASSLVDYRDRLRSPPDAASIARSMRSECVAALAFERGAVRGAIGWTGGEPGWTKRSHLGHPLGRSAAPRTAAPVRLALDDDRIVPDATWSEARLAPGVDLDALGCELEAELAAALVDALAGRERSDLHAPPLRPLPPTSLVAALLRACGELGHAARRTISAESVAALRSVPLFWRAFSTERASLEQACASLGGELVYVTGDTLERDGTRVAGFDPVVLSSAAAKGASALFGAQVRNGAQELARRQALARREQRLATLRLRAPRPLELPGRDPVVRVSGQGLTGLLGLARPGPDRTVIQVRIEGRPLCEEHEPLPCLEAIVDGDPDFADDEVRALSEPGLARVRGAIRDATARLLVDLVTALDRPLAHDEAALRLVRAWCESEADRKRGSAKKVLQALRTAPIFATVQGGRASIADATPGKQLRVAEPVDAWLPPAEGESESAIDAPILAYPAAEGDPVRAILRSVFDRQIRSYTTDVRRVIAARRVRHGISSRPRLAVVPDDRFRWTLEQLAELAPSSERSAFEGLGIGEIALVRGGPSSVSIFEAGSAIARFELEIRPPVAIACEPAAVRTTQRGLAPKDRERLDAMARTVVARALRHLVESIPHDALPAWVRRELRASALLGGPSHLASIEDVPIFETSRGEWVPPRAVRAQAARFGAVWWTAAPIGTSPEPLDPERVVLALTASEAGQLTPWALAELADEELRLDAIARANRDRPPVDSIGPSHREAERALAIAPLDGSGRAGSRLEGTVLALHPADVTRRGLYAFREGRSLGTVPDRAAWPVLAWAEDATLTPNRTWALPEDDGALARLRAAIDAACEAALEAAFPAPTGVLATLRVDAALSDGALRARGVVARGVLAIAIGDEPGIEVIDATGEPGNDGAQRIATTAAPHQREPVALPLSGRLAVVGVAGPAVAAALGALGRAAYARMVRMIGARAVARDGGARGDAGAADRAASTEHELELAELVRAATLGCLDETDLSRALPLPFLRGADRSLGALADAIARGDELLVVPADRSEEALELARGLDLGPLAIVEDGSLAARRAVVGARAVPLSRRLSERILGDVPSEGASARFPFRGAGPGIDVPSAPLAGAAAPPSRAVSAPAPIAPELALPGRIEALIAERGASATRIPITIDLLANAPLAQLRPGGEVELALRHELVRALERHADHPEAIAILAAHVIGVASRDDDDRARVELDAIARLLTT